MKYILYLLFIFFPLQIHACKCVPRSIIQQIRMYQNIIEVEEINSYKTNESIIEYEFLVIQSWKGEFSKGDTVSISQGKNGCARQSLDEDEAYILFFNEDSISQCSPSTTKAKFEEYSDFLSHMDLILAEQTLYFKERRFLVFSTYEEVSESIFTQYPRGGFYWAQTLPVTNIPRFEPFIFDNIHEIVITHAALLRRQNYRPSKKLLRFIEKKSIEREQAIEYHIKNQ